MLWTVTEHRCGLVVINDLCMVWAIHGAVLQGGSFAVKGCGGNQWRKLVSEICKSRALQEHVPLITLSSGVTEPTHTPVAREAQMAALPNWKERDPVQNLKVLCSFAVLMGTSQ